MTKGVGGRGEVGVEVLAHGCARTMSAVSDPFQSSIYWLLPSGKSPQHRFFLRHLQSLYFSSASFCLSNLNHSLRHIYCFAAITMKNREDLHMLFPTDESVDEDYEPDKDARNNRSRQNSLDSSSATEEGVSLAPGTPPSPIATSPKPVTRPLAYRESSLAPPSTVNDLYNATPRSSPAPTVRIPLDTRCDSIRAKLGYLCIESSVAAEEQGDTYMENIAAQLADVHIDPDDLTSHLTVPVREELLNKRLSSTKSYRERSKGHR